VNTHGHPDHTCCNVPLHRATGAALLAHRADLPFIREPWTFFTTMTTRHAVPCPSCGTPLSPASTDLAVEEDRERAMLRCVPCAFTLHGVASSPDRLLQGGHLVQVGDQTARVIHTPGHSPGSIALHIPHPTAAPSRAQFPPLTPDVSEEWDLVSQPRDTTRRCAGARG
jgi:glyoxylase-like metal-dependent hydrolase (beta-lactamase superfamily II)